MTKRKRQPTAEMMREQLRLAADEIINLNMRLSAFCDPSAPYRLTILVTDKKLPQMPPSRDLPEWRAEPHEPWWRRFFP